MNSSHSNDQRPGDSSAMESMPMANMSPQPPPNTTLSMSIPFPGLSSTNLNGGGDQGIMTTQGPPRCQIMSPFMQTPPLTPIDGRLQQQQQAGSSLPMGHIGQLIQDNTVVGNAFGQDLRHHRGYPNVMGLPPAFSVHPNLQSQIQAFQQDMNQHGHMTQPPGFLQGFIPTEMNVAAVVQQQNESSNARTSHLLQPHVRQRARRRSRANRAIQHHAHHHANVQQHEAGDTEGGGALGLRSRSMSEVPTARISVIEAGGGFGDTSIAAAGAGAVAARLDDSKLKGLEENYSSIGENFECNICFQKANEAVVTCCGHLFCWPCLYRWLHIHSYHKECPVCKGAIDESSITPIYGREGSALLSARGGLPGGSAADRIPPRPPARRVESARQRREREDRGREREQRERALERERERDQQEARGLPDSQVLGSGNTLQVEEAVSGPMMRDNSHEQVGQPTAAATGGEIAGLGPSGNSNLEEIDQSEGPAQENTGSGGGGEGGGTPTQTQLGSTGVNNSMHQDNQRGGNGNRASSTGPEFLQRRMSERREQLRAALAASARSGINSSSMSNLTERVDERRQMIAAAALLSQEWEDIVNISRMVGPVNPVQAAAWMSAVQGRLGSIEGTMTSDNSGAENFSSNSSGGPGVVIQTPSRPSRQQHHMTQMHMPVDVGISGAGGGGDDSSTLSRLVTINPMQAGDWLAAMRSRLSNVEKIVENLETTPVQAFQQPGSTALMQVDHFRPTQSTSLYSGPRLFQTVFTASTLSHSEPVVEPVSRLEEEVVPPTQVPCACPSAGITEPPSSRVLEEQTITAITQPHTLNSLSESSTGTTNIVIPRINHLNRSTTQADLRLHYREAPISRPSASRRRSLRMEEITSTSDTTSIEGSGYTAGAVQDIIRSRSKRRRMD